MSFVQKVSGNGDNVSSIAPGLAGVTLGNTLALIVGSTDTTGGVASWSPPTDSSGQTWQKAVGPNSVNSGPADPCKIAIFYLLNANAGTHNLNLGVGSSQFFGYTLVEFPPCTAVDVTTSNSGTSGVTSGDTGTTGATAQADEAVLVGLVTNTSGAGLSNSSFSDPASSGYTSLYAEQNTTAHVGSQHSYKEVSATGAQTGSWTWSSGAQTSWMAVIAAFKLAGGGATPSVSGTTSATPQRASSITITGTNFGASQGTGGVTIDGAAQTVTAWSDTSITVTVVRGTTTKYGVSVNLVVTANGGASSSPFALTSLQPQSGWAYVNVGTPNSTAAYRITATPDLASGDQIAYETVGGDVEVFSDGTFSAASGVTEFDVEIWTSVDGWGSVATQTIVTVQLLRPASTVAAGTWTSNVGGSLHASLDEAAPSDQDYIATLVAGDVCTIAVASGSDPGVNTGHKVRYRVRGDGISGIQVDLMCGATVIATWAHDPAPTEFTTFERILSGSEADAITDYTALRPRFTEI